MAGGYPADGGFAEMSAVLAGVPGDCRRIFGELARRSGGVRVDSDAGDGRDYPEAASNRPQLSLFESVPAVGQ